VRKRIVIKGPVSNYSSYGLLTRDISHYFVKEGYDVNIRPLGYDEKDTSDPIPLEVSECLVNKPQFDDWELIVFAPSEDNLTPNKINVQLTMWESTRLGKSQLDAMNKLDHIFLPSNWNLATFSGQGVQSNMSLCPLGYNSDLYRFAPMPEDYFFTFGAAGRLCHGGSRKGIHLVIDAFEKAFPKTVRDVKLKVKICPDDTFNQDLVRDSRIEIIPKFMTNRQMVDWYQGINCYVSGSNAEGWGLHYNEAMATGRPVIAPFYSAPADFLTEENAYPVKYSLVEATGFYDKLGHWAMPSVEDIASQMVEAYGNKKECRKKGLQAATDIQKYTFTNFCRNLEGQLAELGLIPNANSTRSR
jgi:glycosyltransferase involved in cell wall biosynthesis